MSKQEKCAHSLFDRYHNVIGEYRVNAIDFSLARILQCFIDYKS